jgi:hypothetical protein
LKQLGVEEMRAFRASWSDSANYATKNLERLRSFFRFCQQHEWITKNPARAVKAPRVKEKPTLPFFESGDGAHHQGLRSRTVCAYSANDSCPFCAQAIGAVGLI